MIKRKGYSNLAGDHLENLHPGAKLEILKQLVDNGLITIKQAQEVFGFIDPVQEQFDDELDQLLEDSDG